MESYDLKPPDMLQTRIRRFPCQPPPFLKFVEWVDRTPDDLVKTKKQIEPLEENHRWELAKKMANPYELIYTLENPYFPSSISIIKPLSRSYFKLIEMITALQFFEMLPKQTQKLTSAHIAEGPGGFIQAFLELAEKHKKHVSASYAMTLKPTSANIPGWKRATYFLQNHREVRLTYGVDNTGDIYKKENRDSFIELTKHSCSLYTADGGFDFSVDYEKQEQSIYRLLVCSFLIGLQSLRPGGMMIVKLFDIYSEHTQILLAIVGRQFQSWGLYKPATSRPCNSERYFIGKGFVNVGHSVQLLTQIEAAIETGLYPSGEFMEYEKEYLNRHLMNQGFQQMNALKNALFFSESPQAWYSQHLETAFQKSKEWCRRYQIPYFQQLRPFAQITGGVHPSRDDTSLEDDHPQSPRPDVD